MKSGVGKGSTQEQEEGGGNLVVFEGKLEQKTLILC